MFQRLILVALLVVTTPAVAEEFSSRYVNNTVGFEITKPESWVFMTAEQNLTNLKNTDFGSEEFKQAVVKYSTVPLVVMTQYPEPYDGLNASFKANIKPYGGLPVRTGKAVLDIVIPTLLQNFADAELALPPTEVIVGGRPATHAVVNYLLRSAEGGEFPTTSELWIVPAGDYFFMLGAGYSQGDGAAREAIESAMRSIVFSYDGEASSN